MRGTTTSRPWPELTLAEWTDTRDTVHLWTQVVGKVRLALEPYVNHWWQSTLYVSARGLTTSLMHAADRSLEIEFDFVDHELAVRTTDGDHRIVPLEPKSVAQFYAETMQALSELDVEVDILARPVEIPEVIPFAEDTRHDAYDRDAINRYWRALVEADRLLDLFRGRFIGKSSPVHFFWGAFDLATTRFSGRRAPLHPGGAPNCADWVMHEAYSHEVSSCGLWPGGSEEGSFYAYAYPEPEGYAEQPVTPDAAYYDTTMREFILPYRAVRTADDPDAILLGFLETTYQAATVSGGWDRSAMEVPASYSPAMGAAAGDPPGGGAPPPSGEVRP